MTQFPPANIDTLKAFLDQILSSPDDAYVDSMWNLMGPGRLVFVSGGGNSGGITRQWFQTIRDLLDTVEVKGVERRL
ncbi:hypothetical protein [Roseiarcus fermentans]|nr:hypothetical protein [Roseiarcus fermentans]